MIFFDPSLAWIFAGRFASFASLDSAAFDLLARDSSDRCPVQKQVWLPLKRRCIHIRHNTSIAKSASTTRSTFSITSRTASCCWLGLGRSGRISHRSVSRCHQQTGHSPATWVRFFLFFFSFSFTRRLAFDYFR